MSHLILVLFKGWLLYFHSGILKKAFFNYLKVPSKCFRFWNLKKTFFFLDFSCWHLVILLFRCILHYIFPSSSTSILISIERILELSYTIYVSHRFPSHLFILLNYIPGKYLNLILQLLISSSVWVILPFSQNIEIFISIKFIEN